MIKLNRPPIPSILSNKGSEWTNALLALVKQYGSYSNIPAEKKESILKNYRHQQIKDALYPSSNKKCAFCESFPDDCGNIEIEHFHPKSIYPTEAFDWNNFLPCCRKCNGAKSDHDTKAYPIINPYIDNPENHLDIDIISLKAKDEIGQNTIDVCQLKGTRLYRPYSELLVNFKQFEDDLEDALNELETKDTPIKKRNHLKKIREAINRLENLMDPKSKYSFFCRKTITSSKVYQQAKSLLLCEDSKAS